MMRQRHADRKRLVFGTILVVVVAVFVIVPMNVSAFSGVGSGMSGDPYQISNVDQLQEMNLDLGAYYILVNDIPASETSTWNGGDGFEPIGDDINPFVGTFDGQGYKITDLYINRPSSDYIGLFGVANGEIKNVGLEEVWIHGDSYVGALVGRNIGDISNCHATSLGSWRI